MKSLFLSPLNIAIAVLLVAAAITGFVLIPAETALPVHWGIDGQVDSLQPREIALLLGPALGLLVWALFVLIRRYGAKGRAEAGAYVLGAALTAILLMALAIEGTIVLIGIGVAVNMVQVVCLGLAALMVVLGNAMPKSQPNSFAGIRIPTTLRDPANWQATHRLAGWLLMAGGATLAVAALILPPSPPLLIIALAALLLPLIIGTIYSIALGKKRTAA